ncbi:MAG: histidine kinase, partial [Ktedonobacterales bacterium]|nr:histidine kinase [Ktedonobacterales bacterium]
MSDAVVPASTAATRANNIHSARSHGLLDANIIIANAPDPVFVSDLEGKILSA